MAGGSSAFKLLRLIRRRKLAYGLLDEYDHEHLPYDPERYRRGLELLSAYATDHPANPGAAERWRESVDRVMDRYPSG